VQENRSVLGYGGFLTPPNKITPTTSMKVNIKFRIVPPTYLISSLPGTKEIGE